jgi:hypothetical protein
MCPPASNAASVCSTTSFCPTTRFVDLVAKRADDPARGLELLFGEWHQVPWIVELMGKIGKSVAIAAVYW